MPNKKINGIIDAVRYSADGKIEFVRLFTRRGFVWSDQLLMDRAELIVRIKNGGHYYTGTRTKYLGSYLEAKEMIKYTNDHLSSGTAQADQDLLAGVPII